MDDITWLKIKEQLLVGSDIDFGADGITKNEMKKKNLDIVLDNCRRELPDEHLATFLPIVRGILPNLIANELVGVQAATASGDNMISTLRIKYIEGISDSPGRLNVHIISKIVKTIEKSMSAKFSLDIKPIVGMDTEAEIMSALSSEAIAETDQELLTNLRRLAGTPFTTFDMSTLVGQPMFVGDSHAALAILINRGANLISARTRRGAGNRVVVGPTALTILQSATASAFVRASSYNYSQETRFIGMLNNSINVYCDPYAAENVPVLICYKGDEMDAAGIYSPYLPIKPLTYLIDFKTKERTLSLGSESAWCELENEPTSLGNAEDYVSAVGINTDTLSFV